jgi:hypothetical protein
LQIESTEARLSEMREAKDSVIKSRDAVIASKDAVIAAVLFHSSI